ncbi:MAG: Glucose dehydrogenase, PQQ-dependent (EC [uncultured Paraburkholderia sp.]|nr:MAG: Glucose dehydrogenase, PQQ-dependent (EC [uncultured Paraburkholderia sp.]CAH2933559.1 MAG: Glucose dehydrogenase, PQQ-dependent (EC [uncultured Paraburkholderia sp.]
MAPAAASSADTASASTEAGASGAAAAAQSASATIAASEPSAATQQTANAAASAECPRRIFLPRPMFPQTYVRNSPNMWSVFSVDEKLGMVYLPLGNQTPDQWGGLRTPASEKVAAGVVALDLATGKMRWNYQFTHHDLWDMDVGGQPSLIDLQTASGVQPALIASTKQGSIYVLNRETGKPIVPITEEPVPQGAASGDHTSPTQPFSALNFKPPKVRERDMWGTNPFDQLWCRVKFRSLRYDGMFTPPSEQGSLVFPGNFGVFDWGGVAVDPVRQILIANPSYRRSRRS